MGAGLAYGNSEEMPFIKQFFNGGTNSIRAFRARSIGPGSYDGSAATSTSGFLADQSGDFKLEFNTEYRAQIYGLVKGALFVDAGNIWLLKENANKPGAKLSKDFMNELAVGVGAGLRFDFSFLVLRTDLAFPIRKPYLAILFNTSILAHRITNGSKIIFVIYLTNNYNTIIKTRN